MKSTLFLAAALACLVSTVVTTAQAAVQSKEIEYESGGTKLTGYLAHDDGAKNAPGLLVIHEWWGHNDHARNQAKRFAKEGYVVLALDMYGKGKVAAHPKDAQAFMEAAMGDQAVLKARFLAALELVRKHPQVDRTRIGALGYCFGGTVALTMARAGVDLQAIVTFHAGLKPVADPAKKGAFTPKVLVLTGKADPMIPADQVAAFEKEMAAAAAHAKVIAYEGARHAFTNPDADKHKMDALKYDKTVDDESFAEATRFLKETFSK